MTGCAFFWIGCDLPLHVVARLGGQLVLLNGQLIPQGINLFAEGLPFFGFLLEKFLEFIQRLLPLITFRNQLIKIDPSHPDVAGL